MLDRLPRIWRHLIIQTLAVLLAWAGADLVPWLRDRPDGWAALAGAALGQLVLILTPLVRYLEPDADGRHEDAGSARSVLVALVGFALAGILVVATLLAGPAEAHRRQAEHVRTNDARVCDDVLLVAFSFEELHGRAWGFVQDDGMATVQLRHQGAAAGPGGHWETYPSASGGEGHARVSVAGLPYWDAVRVVHRGIASSERLPVECAA